MVPGWNAGMVEARCGETDSGMNADGDWSWMADGLAGLGVWFVACG